MPWSLEHVPRREYPRNPLAAVIAQVRFHPVLKVPSLVAEFQDFVRDDFPTYQERIHRNIEISMEVSSGVQVQEERQFVFSSSDKSAALFLSAAGLGLESRKNYTRRGFQESFCKAFQAFQRVYGSVSPTRLGLRYVNSISKQRIASDLERQVSWGSLVGEEFIRIPGGPQLGEDTSFSGEVVSSIGGAGHLSLRYGLIRPPGAPAEFRLDIDRYSDQLLATEVPDLLDGFADDISAVFQKAVGDDLDEWMQGDDGMTKESP